VYSNEIAARSTMAGIPRVRMRHIWVKRSWSVLLATVLCAVLIGGAGFLAGRRFEYRVVKPELARLRVLDQAAQAVPEPPKAAR